MFCLDDLLVAATLRQVNSWLIKKSAFLSIFLLTLFEITLK